MGRLCGSLSIMSPCVILLGKCLKLEGALQQNSLQHLMAAGQGLQDQRVKCECQLTVVLNSLMMSALAVS